MPLPPALYLAGLFIFHSVSSSAAFSGIRGQSPLTMFLSNDIHPEEGEAAAESPGCSVGAYNSAVLHRANDVQKL